MPRQARLIHIGKLSAKPGLADDTGMENAFGEKVMDEGGACDFR
jgi:hypothetical protein